MIYGNRKNGGEHGTVFTKPEVVDFMLDLAGLKSPEDYLSKKCLDPSVGEGAFILGLTKRILNSFGGDRHKVARDLIARALANISVAEIDSSKLKAFKERMRTIITKCDPTLAGLENCVTIFPGDYLLLDTGRFDVVVGNPPYVRYDNIPALSAERYRMSFSCFRERCDLYVAFIEKALKALRPGGSLVYICADRWLTNSYGDRLRKLIARNFHFADLIKIEGFSPFNEKVVAYPSIFRIVNAKPGGTRLLNARKISELAISSPPDKAKNVSLDENGNFLISEDRKDFVTIEDQGFTIGIGVATGADDVLIVKKAEVTIEDDVLVPLITRKDTIGDRIVWKDRYVINPYFGETTRLIDLDGHPLLAHYLEGHRTRLSNRHVAKRNPDNWYRTIDRITPSLVRKPKLLIPDISSQNAMILDPGQYYPHHNFYYIIGASIEDLAVLRALLSSAFIRRQVAEKGVLMNGGTLRWQAQTLRKLKLPDIRLLTKMMKDDLIAAYGAGDFDLIESLAGLRVA